MGNNSYLVRNMSTGRSNGFHLPAEEQQQQDDSLACA